MVVPEWNTLLRTVPRSFFLHIRLSRVNSCQIPHEQLETLKWDIIIYGITKLFWLEFLEVTWSNILLKAWLWNWIRLFRPCPRTHFEYLQGWRFQNLSCSRSVYLTTLMVKHFFLISAFSLVGLVTGASQLFTVHLQEFRSVSSIPLLTQWKTGITYSFGFLFSELNKFSCLGSSPLSAFHWSCSVCQCLSWGTHRRRYSSICWVGIWGEY